MQLPDGAGSGCSGVVQLDVQSGRLEVAVGPQARGGAAATSRSWPVSCLADAAKALGKHSRPRLRLDKAVHTVLRGLQPSHTCTRRLLDALLASVNGSKGAPSM